MTPYYDPTIAKLIAYENDRLMGAPDAITIEGVSTVMTVISIGIGTVTMRSLR